MRALANTASAAAGRFWLPGLPHAVLAAATWPVFGGAACAAGLLLATLASFVIYLPLTALALNGGRPIPANAPAPAMTPRAHAMLLALWTATAWASAAFAAG
ncbi:MAG TPA: hypothetical protein VHO91_12065 [Rhodopila sp.]|nr:hypothetical protein [Rhodopila sp.]